MRLTNYKNETAQVLLNKVVRQEKQGFKPISVSSNETVVLERKLQPGLIRALEAYADLKLDTNKTYSKEEKKQLNWYLTAIVRELTMTDSKMEEFMSGWINRGRSYTYNLFETSHDKTVIWNDSLRKSFYQDYELQKTIQYVSYGEYMCHYNGWVLWVDIYEGIVYKLANHFTPFDSISELVVDVAGGTVDVITAAGAKHRIYECRELVGDWDPCNGTKTEGSKTYNMIQLSHKCEDIYGKGYYIMKHHLIAMCAWGYNIMKFCRGNCGLFTIDHIDSNKFNNKIENLRLMPRSDNTKRNTNRGYTYDWVGFFKRVEQDKIEYNHNKEYFDTLDANIAI